MENLSDKILNILLENNIPPEDIDQELNKILIDINTKLWKKINISKYLFFNFKDTVFYNFEHLKCNPSQPRGKTNMRYYGEKFPILMYQTGGSVYMKKDLLKDLINELKMVLSEWNENIYIANLSSTSDFLWIGGNENPSDLIIYNEEHENPKKYINGSSNAFHSTSIVDKDGNKLKQKNEYILCSIKKIDEFKEYNLLTNVLNTIYYAAISANENNKGLLFDFEDYDYKY